MQGDWLLHLPDALPDETLYSLLARIAVVNGMDDHLHVFRVLFGHRAPSSIVQVTDGLDRFCEATDGAYGSVDVVVSRYTINQLIAHLIGTSTLIARNGLKVPIWLRGEAFDYSGNSRKEWRECPTCRREDDDRLGFSYWRRSLQLPTTYCCPLHGDILRYKRLSGKSLHERFWLPHEVEESADAISLPVGFEVAKALAEIGRDGLNDQSLPYGSDVIRTTFIEMLRLRGVITRSGRLKLRDCLDSFATYIDTELYSENLGKELKRLLGLAGSYRYSTCQHYPILIYWLFGTWQHFKERCRWWSAMVDGTLGQPEKHASNKSATNDHLALLAYHRAECLDFIKTNPNAIRANFLKEQYKSFRWLLGNDRAWLENQLPVTARKIQQADLFDA